MKVITMEMIAIETLERRNVLKKLGMNNFINAPKKTIGRVPIKIDFANF